MQRDPLLLAEMIDAAERIVDLTAGRTAADFEADRDRREALLWSYTVLGEAASQVSEDVKAANPHVLSSDPIRLRNRIVHRLLVDRARHPRRHWPRRPPRADHGPATGVGRRHP